MRKNLQINMLINYMSYNYSKHIEINCGSYKEELEFNNSKSPSLTAL